MMLPLLEALSAQQMDSVKSFLQDFSLVTKNTKDYPMPELRLYEGET